MTEQITINIECKGASIESFKCTLSVDQESHAKMLESKAHPKAVELKRHQFTHILPVLDVKGDLIKAIMTPNKLKPDEEIRCDYRYTSCKYCGEMKPKTSLRSDGLCVVCAHGMNTTGSPPHEKLGPRDEIRRGYRYTPCKSCGEMKPKSMLAINGLCEDCEKRTTGTGFDESVKITIKK